ncbi:MAG TPA: hypothetical protein VF327_12880, partial [Gaiellaceae bacterium]
MSAPILEQRRADGFVETLRERLPAYVPGWRPQDGGAGDALLRIYARFLDALGERIDRAPDKNELAFLDLLGLELLPAQAARAPVVLATMPQLGDGRAPSGTRLAAKSPGGGDPIVFETETAIALAAARIAEVVTVWPGKDAYADHTADAIGGRPFTLWEPLRPIRHELYLAHDLYFALAGRAAVALDVELSVAGSAPLPIAWQYWDGDLWRDFRPLDPGDDSTVGLTRSGTVRLHSDCAQAKPTVVGGVTSCWLRAVLAGPLPPDGSRVLPQIDRVQLHTVLERRLATSGKGGLLPDNAFAGGAKLDATKPFQPFGAAPGPDASFVFACEEAFSRPGAAVTIGIDRPYTAQELNDIKLLHYELGVNEAKARLDHLRTIAASLDAVLKALVDPTSGDLREDATTLFDQHVVEDWYADLYRRVDAAYKATHGVTVAAQSIQGSTAALVAGLVAFDVSLADPTGVSEGIAGAFFAGLSHIPVAIIAASTALVVVALAEVARDLSSGDPTREAHLDALQGDLSAVSGDIATLTNSASTDAARLGAAVNIVAKLVSAAGNYASVVGDLSGWPITIFLSATEPSFFQTARDRYAEARRRIDHARGVIQAALGSSGSLVDLLDQLTPEIAAAAAGVLKPKLPEPTLVWEYWN